MFNSICIELQRNFKDGRGPCVQMFTEWRTSMEQAEVRTIEGELIGWHSYLAIDFDRTSPYSNDHFIWMQNSHGQDTGENGYHKYYRSAVNHLLSKWGNTCKIPAPLTATQIAMAKEETPVGKIQRAVINLYYSFCLYLVRIYGRIHEV